VGGALLVPAHELPKQHLQDELCNDDYIRFATCGTFETLEPLAVGSASGQRPESDRYRLTAADTRGSAGATGAGRLLAGRARGPD